MHPHELLFMKGLVTIASNITVIWSLTFRNMFQYHIPIGIQEF